MIGIKKVLANDFKAGVGNALYKKLWGGGHKKEVVMSDTRVVSRTTNPLISTQPSISQQVDESISPQDSWSLAPTVSFSKFKPKTFSAMAFAKNALQAVASFFVSEAHAQTTSGAALVLSHQGRLMDANDQPVTGSKTITFLIYDTADRGVRLGKEQASWWETREVVLDASGYYNVILGDTVSGGTVIPETALLGNRWLAVEVVGDGEMSPRLRLAVVPYAVYALNIPPGRAVTSVTAGEGLTGGPITGSGELAVDFDAVASKEHLHDERYVQSIGLEGGTALRGDVQLAAGTNVTLTESGQTLTIAATNNWATSGDNIYNTNSGNVGIGTTAPAYTLDVNGDIGASGSILTGVDFLMKSGNQLILDYPTYSIYLSGEVNGGKNQLWIRADDLILENGNVGIGTTTPQGKIDIHGTIAVSGNKGIAGQVLTSQGPSAVPVWAAPTAGATVFFTDTLVFDGTVPTSWTALDLSSAVGANNAIVMLRVENPASSYFTIKTREGGATANTDIYSVAGANLSTGTIGYIIMKTDTAGRIQWQTTSGGSARVFVLAYIK